MTYICYNIYVKLRKRVRKMTKKAIEQFLKDKGNLPYVISIKSERSNGYGYFIDGKNK